MIVCVSPPSCSPSGGGCDVSSECCDEYECDETGVCVSPENEPPCAIEEEGPCATNSDCCDDLECVNDGEELHVVVLLMGASIVRFSFEEAMSIHSAQVSTSRDNTFLAENIKAGNLGVMDECGKSCNFPDFSFFKGPILFVSSIFFLFCPVEDLDLMEFSTLLTFYPQFADFQNFTFFTAKSVIAL